MTAAGRVAPRPVEARDAAAWLRMRLALWPDGSAAEHAEDIDRFFAGASTDPLAVLVAEDPPGALAGFAELSIRNAAEGCRTNRVAYLEGWYVRAEARRRGIGRSLIEAAEEWARAEGCLELASDARAENHAGAAAHAGAGFEEVGLIRCFRKDL